ncbi:hypothetical protein ACSBR2_012091 [Camellia fascicularis]
MNSIIGDYRKQTQKKVSSLTLFPSLFFFLKSLISFHISLLYRFNIWIAPLPPHLSLILRFIGESPVAIPISSFAPWIGVGCNFIIEGHLSTLMGSKGIQAANLKISREKLEQEVLKACLDLKLGSSLLDFECHFNESLEKKMR